MEGMDFPTEQEMAMPLVMPFTTERKVAVQSDTHKMGEMVETLIVEFDRQKYEEFVFSGSASRKTA